MLSYSGSTTRLYYTIGETSTWPNCRDTVCPGLGGTFASITSQFDQQFFVSNFFQNKFPASGNDWVWFGGYDTASTNGQCRFLYGKNSNDELADMSFVSWFDATSPSTSSDYLTMPRSGSSIGKWADVSASFSQTDARHCLCQKRYRNSDNNNECSVNPCMNGASCIDGVDSYACNCVAGYSGSLCQTIISCTDGHSRV